MKKVTKIILIIVLILLVLGIAYFIFPRKFLYSNQEPLLGGCAGVAPEYTQECCDRWAEENDIAHIACIGGWTIKDNRCAWQCGYYR